MPRLLMSSQTVAVDLVEFYTHSVFEEDSQMSEIIEAAERIRTVCESSLSNSLPTKGRVYNRLLMTGILVNVCACSTTTTSVDDNNNNDDSNGQDPTISSSSLYHWTAQDWTLLLEKLEYCRTCMMKSNADTYPPEGYNDDVNDDYKDLPMFNDVYLEVKHLLQVHVAISNFRAALKSKSKAKKDFFQYMDEYTNALPPHYQEGDLVDILKKGVLFTKKNKNHPSKKVLDDLESLLLSPNSQSQKKPFSYAAVQRKVKTLLRTWNESILQTPTLVRLGYGGAAVNNNGVEDTKTVSSWGEMAEDEQDGTEDEKEDEEDYHTADEMDDEEDDNDEESKKMQTEFVGSPQVDVRPRENWMGDFTLVGPDEDDCADDVVILKPRKKNKKRPLDAASRVEQLRAKVAARRKEAPASLSKQALSKKPNASTTNQHQFSTTASTASNENQPPATTSTGKKQTDDWTMKVVKRIKKRRYFFTKIEKEAILKGVSKHGTDAWDEVLSEFDKILGRKTVNQCKDCYESMKENGEVLDV